MDINQLLHNHQLAKLNAQFAFLREDRETNFDLVRHYAKRITAWRESAGLSDAGWPSNERLRTVNSG